MDRQSWLEGTLYRPDFEQDSCGFGLMAQLDDQPSHWLVQTAISSLACLTHRGAVAADGKSGDGCGLLFKKPDAFLRTVAAECGFNLAKHYAAGLVFLNQDAALAAQPGQVTPAAPGELVARLDRIDARLAAIAAIVGADGMLPTAIAEPVATPAAETAPDPAPEPAAEPAAELTPEPSAVVDTPAAPEATAAAAAPE